MQHNKMWKKKWRGMKTFYCHCIWNYFTFKFELTSYLTILFYVIFNIVLYFNFDFYGLPHYLI